MFFPTIFKEDNTDIIYNPNFLPLLHSTIYGLVNKNVDNEWRISEVEDKSIADEILKSWDISGESFVKPGFYKIDKETIAVNIDPVESNPATLTMEMAKNLGIKIITPESMNNFIDLTNLFLIFAFCGFLFEIILLLL